ncbi:MAG: enoyl-CoA hydratase [Rhizobiales bacterium 65-9]|nr:crotonase/enoyl-CoA hydratase family protein [Hyphomicrobiales bacterium]OJY32395.1 MAG: enoyl-CoA hydratase [Rhizobiales bacterium 65-9]
MSEVLFEANNGVAVITINRPDAKNAVNLAVSEGVAAGLDEIARRDDIMIGVITGAGGAFCAGMDLKAFLRGEVVKLKDKGFAGITQATLAKPMIAAVEGYALGGGFEIAIACDLIVAAETARFGLPEVKRGLVANAGGLVRLPFQLPSRIAAEFVLTGDLIEPARLLQYGLINKVTKEGEALSAAKDLAARIAANGPLAIAASRRVMAESRDWSRDELFERQAAITGAVFTSQDAKEGARAFAEKRKPVWRGV